MAAPAPQRAFLPHINGLRALAILGIVFYHLRAAYCPAGYFGVDLFLVISGYLLFGSLLREGAAEHFHYGRYLLGKAWRILPSWAAMVLATLLSALLLMHPGRVWDVAMMACSSSFFLADAFADLGGSYFNPVSQQNPLLHLWYLSLTQQLYLIAPLLVIPLARLRSRRAAAILLAVLGTLSLAIYIATTACGEQGQRLLRAMGAHSAYYHLIPRFWELAAGAAVCLLPAMEARPRLRQALALLGLAGVAASFFLYETGATAVYLTVACSLPALRYGGSGQAARLLSLRPMQALGSISFSLYLWHWPLMVFWKYCCFDSPGPLDDWGMLAASLLLGALAWWGIERARMPELKGRRRLALRVGLVASLPFCFAAAMLCYAASYRLQEGRGPQDWGAMLGCKELIQNPQEERDPDALRGLEGLPALHLIEPPLRLGAEGGEPRFLLIGDSHAQHLYDALHAACCEAGLRGVYLNNTVSPYDGLLQDQVGADTCRWNPAIAEALLRYLDSHPSITHLVIAQCWKMRMEEGLAQDGRTGQPLAGREARLAVTAPGLGLFCDRVRALGKEVVLLGETPRFPNPCPLDEWDRSRRLGVERAARSLSEAEFEERHAAPLATQRRLAAEERARLIELAPALRVGNSYPAQHGSEFWYYDANHLTPAAARRAVRHLLPQLQAMLSGQPR